MWLLSHLLADAAGEEIALAELTDIFIGAYGSAWLGGLFSFRTHAASKMTTEARTA